jgi:hypothetical protein
VVDADAESGSADDGRKSRLQSGSALNEQAEVGRSCTRTSQFLVSFDALRLTPIAFDDVMICFRSSGEEATMVIICG